MASFSSFIERFRRITNGGAYLPEIDGLRFIAIALVVFVMHMSMYLHGFVLRQTSYSYLYRLCIEGGYGVALFFIISGFILSLPFAKQHFAGTPVVDVKKYFLRRLTRIEPSYIISLVVYFIIRVWVLQYESFIELFPHFFASLFYVHTIVYHQHPLVNSVAWSLEVEVQFYLLAPLFCYLYRIKNKFCRRVVIITLIIAGTIIAYRQQFQVGNILNNACYFISGLLLAELFFLTRRSFNEPVFTVAGICCFIVSLFISAYYVSIWFCLLRLLLTIIFFFFALKNVKIKQWLSYRPVAIIGGMCYSIYLVHQGIFGLLRHHFASIPFSNISWLNASIHYCISLLLILLVSSIFFLLVERPTMRKDWYKNVLKKKE